MKKLLSMFPLLAITLSTKAQCPDLTAAMVNSCGTSEGNNEFILFTTAASDAVNTYRVNYGTTSPPSTNALSGSDAVNKTGTGTVTATGCTIVQVTSPSTIIPAGAKTMFIPAGFDQNYDITSFCSGGTVYVVYININSVGGVNSPWPATGTLANAPAGARFLQVTYSGSAGCSSANAPVKAYTNGWASNIDGNFVTWNGTSSVYTNNGCSNIILPVTLSRFTAARSGKNVQLSWQTSHESNSQYFAVLKSADGIRFTETARTAAAGQSNVQKDYSLMDMNPGYQTLYYRLAMVDKDGRSSSSSIIKVGTAELTAGIKVSPVPANNTVYVNWYNTGKSGTLIQLLNMTGNIVFNQQVNPAAGFVAYTLPVAALAPGTYVIKVTTGNQIYYDRIIIAR